MKGNDTWRNKENDSKPFFKTKQKRWIKAFWKYICAVKYVQFESAPIEDTRFYNQLLQNYNQWKLSTAILRGT